MIANSRQVRPRYRSLIAALAAVALLGGLAPSAAATPPPDDVDATEAAPQAGEKKAPAKKKKLTNKQEYEASIKTPMLPAAHHWFAKILPEKASTIHKYEWVIRPAFALLIVAIVFLLLSAMYRKRAVLPTRLQTFMEMIVEGLDNLICGILGEKYGRRFLPFLGALFLYIVCLNWFGQVPLMFSPTSWIACTAGLAICTFCVVQYTQFTKLGFKGVMHHWAGEPQDVVGYCVAIILFPLHIIEEGIKPLSLALRLFGNIFGEDVLLGSMLMLGILVFQFLPANGIPVGLPLMLPFQFLALLLSTIQALVFTLLSAIYILMILPHDDHEHEEHAESHA